MCNIQSPNTRVLIIEVLENGKVSLPPVIHQPEHTLTIDELKKCRDYLDLIISNPDNFHIVSLEPLSISDSVTTSFNTLNAFQTFIPKCKSCHTHLSFGVYSQTERDNELCFKCEKKQILKASDPNRREVGNYADKIMADQSPIIVNVKDDIAMPAITQNDDKICGWPGCSKTLGIFKHPKGWEQGHCISHDINKQHKLKKINSTDITKTGPWSLKP